MKCSRFQAFTEEKNGFSEGDLACLCDACIGVYAGEKVIFRRFQRGNACALAIKKQQFRGKKAIFHLENRMFSSSIRNASVEAVLRW
jgi:hypothetical protein